MIIICPYCKKEADIPKAYVLKARSVGAPKYCSKLCSGLARKIWRTDAEKKAIKKLYDEQYRTREYVKLQKNFAFHLDYRANPEKYRKERQRKMKAHIEYCRKPEYKKWKKQYDHKFRLKKKYGEYWECASIMVSLDKTLNTKEIKINQGLINKSQKRKRKWLSKKPNSMPRI